MDFERRQQIRDFATRTHYAGQHQVELIINGQLLAESSFDLLRQAYRDVPSMMLPGNSCF